MSDVLLTKDAEKVLSTMLRVYQQAVRDNVTTRRPERFENHDGSLEQVQGDFSNKDFASICEELRDAELIDALIPSGCVYSAGLTRKAIAEHEHQFEQTVSAMGDKAKGLVATKKLLQHLISRLKDHKHTNP